MVWLINRYLKRGPTRRDAKREPITGFGEDIDLPEKHRKAAELPDR